MKKWEYAISAGCEFIFGNFAPIDREKAEKFLNEIGAKGWELVHILPDTRGIFKREIPDSPAKTPRPTAVWPRGRGIPKAWETPILEETLPDPPTEQTATHFCAVCAERISDKDDK